jgi:two-component system, NarL family, sensor histidine kinase DegS
VISTQTLVRQVDLRRRVAVLYLAALALAGAASLVANRPPVQTEYLAATLLFAVLIAATEAFPIRFPWGSTSVSLPVLYGAYAVLGAPGAAWAAAGAVAAATVGRGRPVRTVLFNAAQFTLATVAGGLAMSHAAAWASGSRLLAMAAFAAAFTAVNLFCVDLWMWLRLDRYSVREWLRGLAEEGYSLLLTVPYMVAMLLLLPPSPTLWPILATFLPLFVLCAVWYLHSQLRSARERIGMLARVALAASGGRSLSDSARVVLEQLGEVLAFTLAAVYVIRQQPDGSAMLEPIATAGRLDGRLEPLPVGGKHLLARTVREARPLVIGDLGREQDLEPIAPFRPPARAALAVPVMVGEQVLGAIAVTHALSFSFRDGDAGLVTALSSAVAAAIRTDEVVTERERNAVMAERQRFSRDIHDGLAQALGGLVLEIDQTERLLQTGEAEGVAAKLHAIREALRDNLTEVRRSIYNLRPQAVEQSGLVGALRKYLAEFGQETGAATEWKVEGRQTALPAPVEDALFHIAHEALSNVKKHAGASRVSLCLSFARDRVTLRVGDDGAGFDLLQAAVRAHRDRRFGLLGMNERTRLLGGVLHVESAPGKGTSIEVGFSLD